MYSSTTLINQEEVAELLQMISDEVAIETVMQIPSIPSYLKARRPAPPSSPQGARPPRRPPLPPLPPLPPQPITRYGVPADCVACRKDLWDLEAYMAIDLKTHGKPSYLD